MDEGFDVLGLNRFGGGPGGGPSTSTSNETRGRFFVPCLLGFGRGINFFEMWAWGFGFGFARLELTGISHPPLLGQKQRKIGRGL